MAAATLHLQVRAEVARPKARTKVKAKEHLRKAPAAEDSIVHFAMHMAGECVPREMTAIVST